jgi:hypothetical protein
MATRPDVHQSLTSNRISFTDTYMGRQLYPSRRQGNNDRTRSLIRKDVGKNYNSSNIRATPSGCRLYYGNCVQQSCSHPDSRETSSERGLNMESVKHVMERRLHNCLFGRPQLASGHSLEKSESVSI